jgi:hypothetical protein
VRRARCQKSVELEPDGKAAMTLFGAAHHWDIPAPFYGRGSDVGIIPVYLRQSGISEIEDDPVHSVASGNYGEY